MPPQPARLNLLVFEGRISKAELLQQPAGPSFVVVGNETAVQADARALDLPPPRAARGGEIASRVPPNRAARFPGSIDGQPGAAVRGAKSRQISRRRAVRPQSRDGRFHGIHLHPHQQRQSVRRDIVRALRRPAGIQPHIGIVLPLEQRLGPAAVRLRHPDYMIPGAVVLDFHLPEGQRLQ